MYIVYARVSFQNVCVWVRVYANILGNYNRFYIVEDRFAGDMVFGLRVCVCVISASKMILYCFCSFSLSLFVLLDLCAFAK